MKGEKPEKGEGFESGKDCHQRVKKTKKTVPGGGYKWEGASWNSQRFEKIKSFLKGYFVLKYRGEFVTGGE